MCSPVALAPFCLSAARLCIQLPLPLPRVHLVGITLVHGAISFGSEFNTQRNYAQCAVVGIGLVSIQLASAWNWAAGAPR